MDIDIVIKGGQELSEFYPKNYEAFEKKISEMIVEMFPGVGGWWISPVLTDRHQAEEEQREKIGQEHFKQTLIRVLNKYPELLEKIRAEPAPSA
jgi:hypothetical protein